MLGQNQETQYWQLALSLPHEKRTTESGLLTGEKGGHMPAANQDCGPPDRVTCREASLLLWEVGSHCPHPHVTGAMACLRVALWEGLGGPCPFFGRGRAQ